MASHRSLPDCLNIVLHAAASFFHAACHPTFSYFQLKFSSFSLRQAYATQRLCPSMSHQSVFFSHYID